MAAAKISEFKPVIIAVVSFLIISFVILKYNQYYAENKKKEEKEYLFELLVGKKSQLEKALSSRLYYTKGIAAYCSINPNITDKEFYALANEIIKNDSVINSMALSRNCIINAIHPLKGHESALGLKLLEHPMRRKIVEKTIETKNTFVAGPVELIEGGIAFISYTPIFTKSENDSLKFWGVTDIVILKEKLFNEIKLYSVDTKYKYSLRGVDGTGKEGDVFFGDGKIFEGDYVSVDILLPTGNWTFAGIPVSGWDSLERKNDIFTYAMFSGALVISLLIWQLSKAYLRIKKHEKELSVLFGAMQELVIMFDKNGKYLNIAPTNERLLYKPKEEMLGKTLHQIFDKPQADFFLNSIRECIETKKTVIIDYKLVIESKDFWFQAHISYLNEDTAIYVAHDNTEKRKSIESLIKSEQLLKQTNESKDKFFRILAHDLKGPFQSFLGYSELLSSKIDTLTNEEIRKIGYNLNKSLRRQYLLLNDLLDWSKLQLGDFSLIIENFSLRNITSEVTEILSSTAESKSVRLINNIKDSVYVDADVKMIKLVLRNLISNGIKYSNINGRVEISAEERNDFIEIKIKDNGVGIESENLDKLFKIEYHFTTEGTANEKGSGLGLNMCKEIIEKHGGRIYAESKLNIGSTFTLTIPVNKTYC